MSFRSSARYGFEALILRSFAMMELSKTLATLFRLFKFERAISKASETREGFIVKITECKVKISLRK